MKKHILIAVLGGGLVGAGLLALITTYLSWRSPLLLANFTPETTPTHNAAIASNPSLLGKSRSEISLGLADTQTQNPPPDTLDLTQLELTLGSVALHQTDTKEWYQLDLTYPTQELFSLRGARTVATLGNTPIAQGKYDQMKLTLKSAKARRTNGQIVEISIPDANRQLTIGIAVELTQPGHQLILDMPSNALIEPTENGYKLRPAIAQLIIDDQPVGVTPQAS